MAAKKLCKANVGTRAQPRECAEPIADAMLACCRAHRSTLIPTSTPGIYARGGAYVAVWRHRGKQYKSFHRTLAEAREAKADRTGSSRPAPSSKRPFTDYARTWVRTAQGRTRQGLDEDTRRAYSAALEAHAIPHLDSRPLRDIDRSDINALITKLQKQGLSAASIAKYIAPLRALFGDAVENGHVSANPALGLKINAKARSDKSTSGEPARAQEMTRAELAAVLAAVPEQHRLPFELMAHTGCRISEILGLDWSDITFGEPPMLHVQRQWYLGKLKPPKTAAGVRMLELPASLAARLWTLGADATGPILHTRTGRRLSARNLARTLETARALAGVPGVTHHTFRHTHGSMLLDEGWTIAEVAERLGHADPAITAAVYTHRMRDRRRELDFLNDLGHVAATGGQQVGNATPGNSRK
jgi:integrase